MEDALPTAESPAQTTTFPFFTSFPPELQLHVFTFVLDWMIAETRGRLSYGVENFTNIRQLLYEFAVNPLLRTNHLIRSITLTAWRLALLRNKEPKTEREERREEKALWLIGLLEDEKLHLEGIRLLLTSNARWWQIKAQLLILQSSDSTVEQEHREAVTTHVSTFRRLSAASHQIELRILSYANQTHWPGSASTLKIGACYHCPDLPGSDPLNNYPYWVSRCRSAEDWEEIYQSKVEESRNLHRGSVVAVKVLERTTILLDIPWRKQGWNYKEVRTLLLAAAEEFILGQRERLRAEQEAVMEQERLQELELSSPGSLSS